MKPRKARHLKPADQAPHVDDLPPWSEDDELAAFDPGEPD